MGSTQSQEEPDVVRINRSEVPDEYKTVGVSSDVVKRVNSQSQDHKSGDTSKLREELAREREEKLRMREEMARLSELQQRTVLLSTPLDLSADFEERKRIFEETVERVQSRFFAYHRENVCASNEKEIMSCLTANPGRILKCAHLAESYEKCVSDFQQEVLNGK
uniref:CHCH domain-containing protein n=1 Tax=Angiostrongylus cantonensis TaxID=6313 RepID=A0A0K0DGT2_ANGCA